MQSQIEVEEVDSSYNGYVVAESTALATALDQYWLERRALCEQTIERHSIAGGNTAAERDWQSFCSRGTGFLNKYLAKATDSIGAPLRQLWQCSFALAREARKVFEREATAEIWIPVRYDPYDISVAYAYVANCWVTCHSEHYATFRGRSEREVKLATTELRKRMQNHSRNLQLTARRLADFIVSVESEESFLLQQRRDAEARRIHRGKVQHTEPGRPGAGIDADVHTDRISEEPLEQVPLGGNSLVPEEYGAY